MARSTFASQNVESTSAPDHFWKLRCRKSARRCGAKHISKSKCTKHTIVGPLLEVQMSKKCTPLWREAHFQVKMYKTHQVRTTFWKFRCRKSARRCGAKHICKSKCRKHLSSGPLLEVAMSKKCTPLWREAHFQVKMYKTHHCRTTFGSSDVERVHAVVARSTFPSQNVKNTRGSDHFWRFGCRFASIHYTTGHYTTLQYTTLHYITTPVHSTTLNYTTPHYITLNDAATQIDMFARPLHFCCQQLSQASCSTTGSTKIEGKSSLKDARTGHDDEIASKSSENRSGLSRAGKCQRGRALKSCSNNRRLKNMQVMFARPLHFCCQQLSQASCSTTGSTKIEGKSSLKDARTGHDDEIASKSSENRSGLSNSAPRVA